MARLDNGLQRPLTLVSAPAGSGKTTLLSTWAAGCARRRPSVPAAWLTLDEEDGDLPRFLTYLVAAVQTLDPSLGQALSAALQGLQPPPAQTALTALINELAVVEGSRVLVLDDYHRVDSRPVDAAVAFLLEHQPPGLHLVIATREDPALPLARLRAHGQLIELRAADLRFTPAEAAEFLQRVMGLTLSEHDVAALEARTEGWIAGLQLAALSMQGRDDTARFIEAFAGSHRFVLDYLVDEVIRQLPAGVRDFLLETCILDRLCSPLCAAVTGREDAKETLGLLERSNLFLVPLDDTRQWYRYHHLFAGVLQAHLAEAQPERVAGLHQRASAWHEQNGLRPDAIRHALAAGDLARAADLIELALPAMSLSRQFTLLLGWLKALPDELVRARPVLNTGYALTSMACGEMAGVEQRLRDAERWLEAAPADRPAMVVVDQDEFRRLPGRVPLIRAGQALARGDVAATVTYARRARDHAAEDDRLTRGGAATQLGLAAWTDGDLDTAVRMMAEGLADLRLAGYIPPAIGGAITLADIQIALGRLRAARSTFEQGLAWATESGGLIRQGAADMHVGLSALLYEQNDLQAAEQHLRESLLQAAEAGGRTGSVIEILALQALAQHAQGALPDALDTLQRALALAEPEGYVRLFVDAGPGLEPVLREARSRGILPDYAGRLLAAFGPAAGNAVPPSLPDGSAPETRSPLVEPLSACELEVLQLIAQGLTNHAIGARLFLALDTVKGHNRRIFEKLQVQRRTEAVARARALGLI